MLQHEHQSRLTQNINPRYETLSYLILVRGEGWGARLAQGHTAGAGTGRTQPWLLASHPHIFCGVIKSVLTLHKGQESLTPCQEKDISASQWPCVIDRITISWTARAQITQNLQPMTEGRTLHVGDQVWGQPLRMEDREPCKPFL